MTQNNRKNINEVLSSLSPRSLKHALQELANERNITLSALLRLIASRVRQAEQDTMIISIANQKGGRGQDAPRPSTWPPGWRWKATRSC